jgi:multiple sugar transport system permease protein
MTESSVTILDGKRRPEYSIRTILVRKLALRALGYAFLLLVAASAFFPFYTMLISSSHDNFSIMNTVTLIPGDSFVRNYQRLTQNLNLWRSFANSTIIATTSTMLNLYVTAITAYAFAKFNFKGKGFLFGIILFSIMIPGQVGTIGFYKQMSDMHLINSYLPLILPHMANCFGVFFFRQYLNATLPDEIIEASLMDGCKELTIYHRIVLPMMVPALVTQGVLAFIGSWNSYLMPLIIIRQTKKMTLPVLIATVKSANVADFGAQYVGILISVIPLLIIFSFASNLLMDKISAGDAVKG